jgi:hypothetical protein
MAKLTDGGETRALEQGRALERLGGRQYGVVTRAQLIALGLDHGAIDWRLRSGRLRLIHRGVYALGPGPLVQRGHWLAAVLAYGEGATLSHLSAAALWGLAGPRGPAHVTSGHGRPGRAGIRLHRTKLAPDERVLHDRIPVTTVARTIFDAAEIVDEQQLGGIWEEADRLKLLQLREVETVCERNPGRRALRQIQPLLAAAMAPTVTRSPLEDRFAAFCRHYGIPAAETNVHVLGHEVDCLWPAAKLIAELDSWEFHAHRSGFNLHEVPDDAPAGPARGGASSTFLPPN